MWCFFFQAEDGIRALVRSRGLGEVYKRQDNGIGIKESEITRVFEKGFTGENGRITGKKSTGIGLYLCKKLCDKLCIGLELNSKKDEGTEVKLIFPNNSFINMK